ncbi:endoplasmic reticulum aminopeptidase 1-like [Saccoglossus kowalevskii]
MRSFMWNQRYKYQQTEQDDWFEDFDDDAESSKLTSSHGGYQPLDSPGSKNSQSGNVRRIQAAACLGVLIVIVVMILALALPVNQNTKDAFAHSSLRLPRDVLPETYKLFLVPDIKSGYYEGSVDIGVKVVKSTPSVFLHVKGLTLTRTPVILGSRDETIPIRETSLNGTLEMLYIGVEETLLKGMTYNIHIEFHRNLANDFVGFYSTKYKHANGEDSTIATTYLEPTFARQVFPCFDEPDMKAEFTISIVRDKDHISMSNMPLDGESAKYGDTGMMLDTFKTTVKMSTYLVALTVCDFQYVEGYSASRIQVKVYTTPDKINMADHALSTATECLSFYESFFKVPYPLPKMDMIAIPQYNDAGMESWGLISYQESSILYDSQNTPVTVLQDVTAAIAHEIAHQWFGNLVTMKWWNDLWLNEGFATYVEYIGTDHINPEWRMMEQFVYGVTQQAMTLDALHHSHPVSLPVNNPADIKKLFDKISYLKGAAIIRMAMDFLGYDAFRNGLQDYLSAYAYSNAKNDNLWSAFTKSGENGEDKVIVKDVMDTWTLQMGYPVVTLSRNDDTITATQERFLIYPDGELSSNNASPFE